MSAFKLLFTSLLLSATLASSSLYAQSAVLRKSSGAAKGVSGIDGKRPAYNQFCEDGAEELMQNLDNKNKDRFEQLAGYKKQLDDLKKYNAMLSEAGIIKKRYLESIKGLSTTPANNPDVTAKLDDAKSALRNGLTLSAISLLMKKQDEAQAEMPDDLNMEALCKGQEAHVLCQKSPAKSLIPLPEAITGTLERVGKWMGFAESHKLDQTLKNFQTISSMPADQQKNLRQEIKKVLADIPKDVAPESVLEIIKSSSPNLANILTNDVSRDNLFKCLEEKSDEASRKACSSVIAKPEDRKALIAAVSAESQAMTTKLKPVNAVVEMALEENKSELSKALTKYDSSSVSSTQNLKSVITDARNLFKTANKLMGSKNRQEQLELQLNQVRRNVSSTDTGLDLHEELIEREKELSEGEAIFYKRPAFNKAASPAQVLTLQKNAIQQAQEQANFFEASCDFSKSSENADLPRMEKCASIVKSATDNLDSFNIDHLEKMKSLKEKVNSVATEKDFAANENLKEYIALKYICNCQKTSRGIKNSKEESLTLATPTCSEQFMTISKLEGLSDKAGIIAKTLYANEIVPLDDVKSCSFSSEKLKVFTESCNRDNAKDAQATKICESIKNEYTVKIQKNTEADQVNRKWDSIHEKNHVVYNPKTGGYTSVPKKSAMRIFGEGILPVAPSLIPMWLGNWQTKNYISAMTNEALNQKQFLHNMETYNNSPWMYNYNYFLYNPFSFSNNSGALGAGVNSTGFSF